MRKMVLGTAIAVVLGLATPAVAMPLSWPSAIGAAAGNQVELATYGLVCRERCGYYGCRRVCFRPSYGYGHGYYRPRHFYSGYGYHRPHYYQRPYWGGWGHHGYGY
jgi:hypothetical protein